MSNTPRLTLPELAENQASKYITHNEALRRLDGLVQTVCINRIRTAPPVGPSVGDAYIVAGPATGAWAGLEDYYVVYDGSSWRSIAPFDRMMAIDDATSEFILYDAGGSPPQWVAFLSISGGTTFLSLVDTFASYAGNAGKVIRVNLGESALEPVLATVISELTPGGSPLEVTPTLADGGRETVCYITAVSDTLSIINPSGTPVNYQRLVFRIKSAGVEDLVFDSDYRGSVTLPLVASTSGGGTTDYLLFVYNAQDTTWDFIAFNGGF